MKLRSIYTLLTLVILFCFGPAIAQTKHAKKHTVKKTTGKSIKKPAAKKAVPKKPVKPSAAAKQKAEAKSLGDAAANSAADTTKKPASDNALQEEIVVNTSYKPVLADAVKIRRNPDLEDKTPFKAPLTYSPIDQKLELNSEIRQLDAMNMPAEKDSLLSNNYIKVGGGNLKTTYGELYVDNGPDQGLQVGLYDKHFAQQGSLYKQNQSTDNVGIFGKSIGSAVDLSGKIDYKYNSNYFYGYDALTPPVGFDPAHQHFSIISGEAELTRNFVDVPNAFTYALKVQGYDFMNAFKAKENNIVISGFINETVKQFYAGLAASVDMSSQKDSLYAIKNNLLRLNPYLKLQGTNYKVDAGINVVNEFGTINKFYIFPAAKLEVPVIPKYVRLFVEAKGDVNKSNLLDFTQVNPYLGKDIQLKNSIDQLDISAGLKGMLAPGLGFKAFIFRDMVKYLPLIVSNFGAGGNKFAVIYDNGQSRINGFTGEIDYKASDAIDIFGHVEYKQYQLASQAQAWNLPKIKMTAGTILHLGHKVDLTGTILFRGETEDLPYADAISLSKTVKPVTINSFADVSAGLDMHATRKITLFVKVNNLLDTTNQTWVYYPDYGFNIFGGVGFAF